MLAKTFPLLIAALMIFAAPAPAFVRPLTPEAFAVERDSYQQFVFEVSRSARVFGHFRSQGDSGNDIRVYIIDADQLENFKNSRDVNNYYSSGQVANGQIDVRLRFGRYVIIFDNRFPPYASKNITSNVQIEED